MTSITGFAISSADWQDPLPAQAVLSLTSPSARTYIDRMKRRNQLIALFCLAAFVGLGILYFQHWVVQKPFGIVLFIGEGVTPGRLASARIFAGGADSQLALDEMPHEALLTNYSNDFAAPDQAAAATAMATGVKANNGAVATDPDGNPVASILELARAQGRVVGLVTNASLTDPTAAAFYAHGTASEKQEFARSLADNSPLDLVLGGGAADFLPTNKNGTRSDGRDLLLEVRRAGFDLVRTKAELEAVPGWKRPRLFGTFANAELAFVDEVEARSEQPSLADMVRRAIELLQFNRTGYVLVVDVGLTRKAAQANHAERTFIETAELDRAVSTARRFAGENASIFVCGDVGIGGLTLSGTPFRRDSGVALLGLNSSGDPWLTWSSGPHGVRSYGAAKLAASSPAANDSSRSANLEEPAAFYAPSALNTVEDAIVFGRGPGSERLHGTIRNTEVFAIMRDLL